MFRGGRQRSGVLPASTGCAIERDARNEMLALQSQQGCAGIDHAAASLFDLAAATQARLLALLACAQGPLKGVQRRARLVEPLRDALEAHERLFNLTNRLPDAGLILTGGVFEARSRRLQVGVAGTSIKQGHP